jgi:hypothetical protein
MNAKILASSGSWERVAGEKKSASFGTTPKMCRNNKGALPRQKLVPKEKAEEQELLRQRNSGEHVDKRGFDPGVSSSFWNVWQTGRPGEEGALHSEQGLRRDSNTTSLCQDAFGTQLP